MLGYLIYDFSGNIKFVSKEVERRLGYDQGYIKNRRITELLPEGHANNLLKEGSIWGQIQGAHRAIGPVEVCIEIMDPIDGEDSNLLCSTISLFEEEKLGDRQFLTDSSKQSFKGLQEFGYLVDELLKQSISLTNLVSSDDAKSTCSAAIKWGTLSKEILEDVLAASTGDHDSFLQEAVDFDVLVQELLSLFDRVIGVRSIAVLPVNISINDSYSLPRRQLFEVLFLLMVCGLNSEGVDRFSIGAQKSGDGEPESIYLRLEFSVSKKVNCSETDEMPVFDRSKLSLARLLVSAMDGSLKVKDGYCGDTGFSFVLNVPVRRAVQGVDSLSSGERNEKRILVVEDNQLNIDIISHFLRDYGYRFDVVEDGQSAVDTYENGKYDLILMDIMLPVMNGYEATKCIIEKAGEGGAPPVVGVTAKVFRDDGELCLDCGMVEVVHKPIDFKSLKVVLDRLLLSIHIEEEPLPSRDVSVEKVESSGGRVPTAFDLRIANDYLSRMTTETVSREDLIKRYLTELSASLDRIDNAIEEKLDVSEIQRHAHSLKGNLGLVGASNMQDLARGLEMTASRNSIHFKPTHWLNLLRVSYDELDRNLRNLIDCATGD